MDRQYYYGQFSNEQGLCEVNATVSYDRANALITTTYAYDAFAASSKCIDIVGTSRIYYKNRTDIVNP